ncbi:MAG: dual specificity protein phosphatase family protein [Betaproteobacteria bacterium]
MAPDAAPSGALHIDWIDLPGGGGIGMTHCPGRRGRDGSGRLWERDLERDLLTLAERQAQMLITLIDDREFETLGVPGLPAAAQGRFAWHHLPIADMNVPGPQFSEHWQRDGGCVLQALEDGGRVVFHCAAGLGRTGTIVAKLLTDSFGMAADDAIDLVRRARPGTIETVAQEAFVRGPDVFGPRPGLSSKLPMPVTARAARRM